MVDFISLPPELHLEIASHLTDFMVAQLAQASRHLNSLFNRELDTRIMRYPTEEQNRFLIWAAYQNRLDFVKRILDVCPLLETNHTSVILLEQEDFRRRKTCCTALDCAVINGNVDIGRLLLARGADPDPVMVPEFPKEYQVDGDPIFASDQKRHPDRVSGKVFGRTPLYLSIEARRVEFTQFLLANGADPNTRCYDRFSSGFVDEIGRPPLSRALQNLDENFMQTQVQKQCYPHTHCTCQQDNMSIVQLLLEAHADADERSPIEQSYRNFIGTDQFTMRHQAIISGQFQAYTLVSSYSRHEFSEHDIVRLIIAAVKHCPEAVECLYMLGVIKWEERRGIELFHEACMSTHLATVKFFVNHGADICAQNKSGRTPLHSCAAAGRSIEILRYLIDNGADIHACDGLGKNPLDSIILDFTATGKVWSAGALVLIDAGAEATLTATVRFRTKGLKDDPKAVEFLLANARMDIGIARFGGLTSEMEMEDYRRPAGMNAMELAGLPDNARHTSSNPPGRVIVRFESIKDAEEKKDSA